MTDPVYHADASLYGKLRRRLSRALSRKPAAQAPGRPMISFAFDDAPTSAATTGAAILEAYGARGSFFTCAGMAGEQYTTGVMASRDELLALSTNGHEIGCHTYRHLDCGRATEAEIARSVDENCKALTSWGLPAPESFAYPYGDVSPAAKRVVDRRFRIARALHPGLVQQGSDLNQTPGIAVEGDRGVELALSWMDRAIGDGGWLILFTHGVCDEPGLFDCATSAFEMLVSAADGSGFDFVTVGEGARRMGRLAA
jgi:peptidoglycan/xylan/chitin deacetylase (PgdA/CDA1 family)